MLKDISELKILERHIQDFVYQDSVNTESLDQNIHELAEKFKNLINDIVYANVKAKALLNESPRSRAAGYYNKIKHSSIHLINWYFIMRKNITDNDELRCKRRT